MGLLEAGRSRCFLLTFKKMNNLEDPCNTPQVIVGEEMVEELLAEARLRVEEGVERNKINKRHRPSEKDRNKEDEDDEDTDEDLPESKKAKQSPGKTKTGKRGRPPGKDKTRPKKKQEKKETCIFCQEEYLRETLWEGVGRAKASVLQVSICGRCHACLKDDVAMKEIRDIFKKSSCKLGEANKKTKYICGMCQKNIQSGFPSMVCTVCKKWLHRRCITIPWARAKKIRNVFKCKNCRNCEERETPDVAKPVETVQVDDVVVDENLAGHPDTGEGKSNEGDCGANKDKDKSSSDSVANGAPGAGDGVPKVASKVASNPNLTDVEKLTEMVLLFEDDVRSFGGDISNTDLKSLENRGWVTDNIISLVFGNIQKYVNGNKLVLVEPSVTQIFRKSSEPGVAH